MATSEIIELCQDEQGRLAGSPSMVTGADCYYMKHKRRGMAIIFNHKIFDSHYDRLGTEVDRDKLKDTLKYLGFDVTVCNDYKYRNVRRIMEDVAQTDHTENDCLVIAVLSHGDSGTINARDYPYTVESLWRHVTKEKCPTLDGKPKIFFIQACQGEEVDRGVTLQYENDTQMDGQPFSTYAPDEPDFLIAYSTIPGYFSFRNTANGSWFIQTLCKELNLRGKRNDLLTILTFVNRKVAIEFESNTTDPKLHRKKQIPCVTSLFTKLLFFIDKLS